MRKLIPTIFLCFLTLSTSLDHPRIFTKAFIDTALDTSITLNDEYFGANFDSNFSNLKKYFNDDNYNLIVFSLQKILSDVKSTYPQAELNQIITTIQANIMNKSILNNIHMKLLNITPLIVQTMKQGLQPENTGIALGKAIKILMQSEPGLLSFSEEGISFIPSGNVVGDFVKGLFQGLTKEGSKGKCNRGIEKDYDKVCDLVKKVMGLVFKGKEFKDIFGKLLVDFLSLGTLINDCKIFEIGSVVKDITAEGGVQKVVERIEKNLNNVMSYGIQIVLGVTSKDFKKVGGAVGNVVKTVFEFYVD